MSLGVAISTATPRTMVAWPKLPDVEHLVGDELALKA